jgi:hypothetical protein
MLSPCPGDCGVSRKPASYTSSPSAVTSNGQNFANAPSRTTFETSLEQARQRYGLSVYGYVVMPEHIHMLVNEPERGSLSQVVQSLKQGAPSLRGLLRKGGIPQSPRSRDFR